MQNQILELKRHKNLLFYLIMGLLVTACGSTPGPSPDEDTAIETTPAEGSLPETAEISFDPDGSDSGNIEGLQTIRFGYDQSSLTTDAREKLSQNADWIRANGNTTVQIEGHCDTRGSLEYNLALGERRAQAVKAYLVEMGIPEGRLTTISFGEEKPLAEGQSERDHSQNRRANFLPLP